MGMREDVRKDAVDFIIDNDDIFKQALVDGSKQIYDVDYDDNGEFHEAVTDRAYSLEDAVVVLRDCANEETDTGLWEGQQPEDALRVKAAYSYANDVREKLEGLFDDLVELYEAALTKLEERKAELEDIRDEDEEDRAEGDDDELTPEQEKELAALENCEELAAAEAMKAFYAEHRAPPIPVEPGSYEEVALLEQWLRAGGQAGWFGGYPLGGSYIDARCGTGYGMPEVKEFVDFDHEVAERAPHLAGKGRAEVEKYLKSITKKRA